MVDNPKGVIMEKIIELTTHKEDRGSLTVADESNIPFEIKRVFYIHNVPEGTNRGGHAHKQCEQIFITISGRVDIVINKERRYTLDKPDKGLYIPAGLWDDLENIEKDTVILVLCSRPYEEEDYIKNYEDFKRDKNDTPI
jgi:dTDP-4-dehydrorhamnose 3,5-epimerase-like enzyme